MEVGKGICLLGKVLRVYGGRAGGGWGAIRTFGTVDTFSQISNENEAITGHP